MTSTITLLSNIKKIITIQEFHKKNGVISPFVRNENGEYTSDFVIKKLEAEKRIKNINVTSLFKVIEENADFIKIDCLKEIPKELFYNINKGMIHFDIDQNRNVNLRMIIEEINDKEFRKIKISPDFKFRTDKLKIFPVILKNGFIVSIIDRIEVNTIITIMDPFGSTIGEVIRSNIDNIMRFVLPLWNEILSVEINRESPDILIYIRNSNIEKEISKFKQPIMIELKRKFRKLDELEFSIVGVGKTTSL